MELSELIRQTHAEMAHGDYRTAARLCEFAVEHAPTCLTAHRLLGEIRLELQDIDAAIEHFQIALNHDPMNVVVRLGLGAAAEERHDAEAAYACYLHSWEINPELDQVRDRLVLLRKALGVDPRLHHTRAGLARVHLRAGRNDRAIAELRALVEAEPQGRRARCALVEALWRNGDDAAAAAICRGGLDQAPENARYLSVLAEIELRLKSPNASKTLARLHAIDPIGEIASLMAEWRPDRDVSALFAGAVTIPDLPARTIESPISVAAVHFAPPMTPPVTSQLPIDVAVEARLAMVASAPAVAGLDASIQPFSWDEFPAASLSVESAPAGWDDWRSPVPVATASLERPTESVTATLRSARANPPSPFETSDGKIDLTAGWDELDQVLADATPSAAVDDRFADLMAELSFEGLAPFQAIDRLVDESAWEPLFQASEPVVETPSPVVLAPVVHEATPPVIAAVSWESVLAAEPVFEAEVAPVADFPLVVAPSVSAMPAAPAIDEVAPLVQPHAAAIEDEFAELKPFSFEETDASEANFERPFDFGDLDAPTAAPRQPERVSMLLSAPGDVVASALSETFPEIDDDLEAEFSAPAPSPVQMSVPVQPSAPSSSIFQVLRASKHRSAGRPGARRASIVIPAPLVPASPAPMFHVEHQVAPADTREPVFAIGRDELMTLRIRLIEEEHSAGDVARTLESKMSGGGSDPLAARVLGEAYLRLGKSDQAAAQFRQAMLARGRQVGSAAR